MLKTFYNHNFTETLDKDFIFIDNDFLNELFSHEELLKVVTEEIGLKKIYVYPFTEFEFLREVNILESRIYKQKFVENPLFRKIEQDVHMKFLPKFIENALLLSQIYKQENYRGESSFVDLILAGLLMAVESSASIITSNKKDFPPCVFDTLGILNLEYGSGDCKAIYILAFNKEKFKNCNAKLQASHASQARKILEKNRQKSGSAALAK